MIEAWFDGACGPINPGGIASYGILIKHKGNILYQETRRIGTPPHTTNNLAEHAGLRAVLRWLIDNNHTQRKIHIFGDSNLVISQVFGTQRTKKGHAFFGTWKIKKGIYKEIALENQKLRQSFPDIKGTWIPRELNTECDCLSKAI